MQDKSYTISANKAFIHRYADTGFKTKWCGIWILPYKFFEYFAFKVNDTWLCPENTVEFSLEKDTAIHTFALDGISVSESVFAPKKIPAVVAQMTLQNTGGTKKNIIFELEAALNIRTKAENFHTREYEAEFLDSQNAVIVKSDGKSAAFGIGKAAKKISVEFRKIESYKEHYPGGEMQRCFIPGKYIVNFELGANEEICLPFIFTGTLVGGKGLLHNYELCFHDAKHSHLLKHAPENHFSQEIKTPDTEINDTFAFSASNISALLYESDFGTGFFAGYPWFLEFWGRDTFWSIKGLVDLGEFRKAKEILKTMAKFQKERMPCVLHLDGTAAYYGRDVDALFLLGLDYYIAHSGDIEAEKEFGKNVTSSINSLELKDNLVQHAPNETWMDSISRPSTAVEIQSLWIEALKKRQPDKASAMAEKLNSRFRNSKTEFLDDVIGSAKITPNALVPLMFGQLNPRQVPRMLTSAKNELLGRYGITTLSRNDKDFGPAKYHEGATWGLTTAIGACTFFKQGRPNDALLCLKAMAEDSKKHSLGGMSECINSETGELLGCGMQLWSAALFVHAIDRYLFGISAESEKILIEPKMPVAWKSMERKNKKLGKNAFDISILKAKGRYEIDIRFKNTPKKTRIVVTIPENISSAYVNNRPIKAEPIASSGILGGLKEMLQIKERVIGKLGEVPTNCIEFEAEKSNTLIIRTS